MITNQENYLFLKQCLVLLQVQRCGGEVSIDNTVMVETSVYNKALATLAEIRGDFTLPTFTEVTTTLSVNFLDLADALGTLQGTEEENPELAKLLGHNTMKLDQAIMDYPVMAPLLAQRRINQEMGKRFTFSPELDERLRGEVTAALSLVQYWIESPESSRSVLQLVLLLNMVQLTEEMIEFCNDFYIGC